MVDYVVPSGVRIADADRVRLGAHLAAGTTVMHEGFVNFNAGTLGSSMVEGRISAGVVVDDGSDIGGGASIMGTLSGGGSEVISVGKRCLLGANSGLGISLGDDCVVEAGLYVTAGTKVATPTTSRSRPASCPAPTTCCSAGTRSAVPSRWCPAAATASRSTRTCTPTRHRGARPVTRRPRCRTRCPRDRPAPPNSGPPVRCRRVGHRGRPTAVPRPADRRA